MKTLLKIFLFLIIVSNISTILSQPINWQKLYNGPNRGADLGYGVCQTNDKNFVLVGSTRTPMFTMYVLKIDQYGDTLWTKIISSSSLVSDIYTVAPAKDGGCVFSGYSDSAFSIKLDNFGNIIWNKKYQRRNVQCYKIIETLDSGFIGCGRIIGEGGYIFKINKNGDFEFDKLFPDEYLAFKSIDIAHNSGYIVCGTIYNTPVLDTAKAYVLRINKTGDVIWEKRYYELLGLSGKVIKNTGSGYILCGGASIYFNPKPTETLATKYFMKLDTSGNQIYFKEFKTVETQYLGDFQTINKNQFLFIGGIDSTQTTIITTNGLLTITDSLGNIINERTYQSTRYIELESGIVTGNNEIIAVGTWGVGPSFNHDDIYAIKTDSNLFANPVVRIINQNSILPNEFVLFQNYPNPFNPRTIISYNLPNGLNGIVTLKIFNILGKEIITLVNEKQNVGNHSIEFHGDNLPSGIYFYKIQSGIYSDIKKMVLLR